MFYNTNLEIRVTEVLSDVTVREDNGTGDTSILQGRVVSYLPNGTPTEMNSVVFMPYSDHVMGYGGSGRPFGIIASEDNLYPYITSKRIRQYATSVQLHTRATQNDVGDSVEEDIVVMTRSCFLKLHKTSLELSPAVVWGL